MNTVVSGDYKKKKIKLTKLTGKPYLETYFQNIPLSKDTIDYYEVVSQKEEGLGVGGALLGQTLFGIAGAIGMSSKKFGVFRLDIHFKNGKRSLVEVSEVVYNAIMERCFNPHPT